MRAATVLSVLLVVAATGATAPVAAGADTGPSADVTGVAGSHCTFPVTVTDATGTEVTIEDDPQRLVALAPSAAQILWGIGAEDEAVGMPVDYYTGYLNDTEGKTDVVNDDGSVIVEQVVGAQPDLVLAPNVVSNETVQTLRDSGLTVYRFGAAEDLEDVYAKIELYGRLTGNYDEAGRVSARMEGQVEAVRDAVSDEDNPDVFFSLGGGWTAGEDSFIGQLIAAAGGSNIAAGELNRSYGKLSDEVVAQKDPEWVVLNGQFGTVPKTPAFNQSTAVQEGNLVRVDRNFMSQNGPRNVQPLKTMAEAFHPEAYGSIDFSTVETPQPASCTTLTPTADGGTETATADDGTATADGGTRTADPTATAPAADETASTPATAADGPGFTALTGVLALLAAALLFRRREG